MPGKKYTKEEREVARKINRLRYQQKKLQDKYIDIDVKINALKSKLNWKYEDKVRW